MTDPEKLSPVTAETGQEPAATAPDEPFPCPACGQMLAPTCRVCVACKQPVDFAQVLRAGSSAEQVAAASAATATPARALVIERARFSWQIFLLVCFIWLLAANLAYQLLGPVKGQLALGAVVVLTSAWVFYDAQRRGIPYPLRWGIGSILLWILVFPWYLSRRRTPQAPGPFIEGPPAPLARALLLALVVFFVISLIVVLVKGTLGN